MNEKLINIFSNDRAVSIDAMTRIRTLLNDWGYTVTSDYCEDASLIICIGGDGAFLETVHACNLPQIPILGINTGHLGFFEEITPDEFISFFREYQQGKYRIQNLNTVEATVYTNDGHEHHHIGLNEIAVRGRQAYTVHLNLCIDGILIQKFSGDGILCATSAGSTAYNYSLGGSIVDPRIDLLQVTPIAPMNSTAYRSFTSSLLMPSNQPFEVVPEERADRIFVYNDGIDTGYTDVKRILIQVSDTKIKLIRFKDYDFWSKVKSKFL